MLLLASRRKGAVRTGTFMNQQVIIQKKKKHYSSQKAMTTSCQKSARKRMNNSTPHDGDYKNPNMLLSIVMGAAVVLCSLPSWTIHTSAFVVTSFHKHKHRHYHNHGQFVGNSAIETSLQDVSRSTTLRAKTPSNSDDSIVSSTTARRRRRSSQQRTVARASVLDNDSEASNTSRRRTRPKIRLQQQQVPMQDYEEEESMATITTSSQEGKRSSVDDSEYSRRGEINNIRRNNNKKKKKSSSSSKTEFSFYDALMKDHDILTRSQELKLGRAVQRAKPLQLALARLMQQKRLEQQQQQQLNFDDDDDDDDIGYYDNQNCDITSFSFAWERREELEKSSWLASCWQEENGDDDDEGNDNNNEMTNADTLLLETLIMSPPLPRSYYIDSREEEDDDDDKPLRLSPVPPPSAAVVSRSSSSSNSIYISDEDVIRYMNLPGGRAELQNILWNGIVARDTLIRSNIRLVVSIAKKWALQQAGNGAAAGKSGGGGYLHAVYAGGWDRPSLDEAVQEGILGLADAVQRYDPSRKLRFATYATFWITNSIRKCFQSASTTCLRVPASYHDIKSRFNTLIRDHYNNQMAATINDNGGDYAANLLTAAGSGPNQLPSFDVLANELGITKGRLQRILRATKPLLSLDQPRNMGMVKSDGDNQGDVVLADSLSTDDYDNGGGRYTNGGGSGMLPTSMEQAVELSFLRRSLENAMATELAPYERDIVRLRLGLDDGVSRTAKQVVAVYGGDLSETDVRLAERRAFSKLRSPHALSTYKFLAYLDFAGIDKETATLR